MQLFLFLQWLGHAICQMDQGTSLQLACGTRLGVLPEFWKALDCIWANTFAGFSTRSREGDYFSVCLDNGYWERDYECRISRKGSGWNQSVLLKTFMFSTSHSFFFSLFHGLNKKYLFLMVPYETCKPLGILTRNSCIDIIINLKLIFLKIILWLSMGPTSQFSFTLRGKEKEPYILCLII